MNNQQFPRVPSTPEQAVANVTLEAEFHEASTALRMELNNSLRVLRDRRRALKEHTHMVVAKIRRDWQVERTDITHEIEALKDRRSELRNSIHDGLSNDTESLAMMGDKIRDLRLRVADRELDTARLISEEHRKLDVTLSELGRETIRLQHAFHTRHTALRRELQEKVAQNRRRAYEARCQEGGDK
ncbi:MAG: hypothetical protein IJK68_06700 [Muribaculaceae bacterium]|nr:hypothetical protein [Muribaculaceae bacterium]